MLCKFFTYLKHTNSRSNRLPRKMPLKNRMECVYPDLCSDVLICYHIRLKRIKVRKEHWYIKFCNVTNLQFKLAIANSHIKLLVSQLKMHVIITLFCNLNFCYAIVCCIKC